MKFIDWGIIEYHVAWEKQRAIAAAIIQHKQTKINEPQQPCNTIVFCEHPHVYTLGRNGKISNLLINNEFLKKINATYFHVDRGGDITYHGYGQIVCYPILDLESLHLSLKSYIFALEEAVINTLRHYNIVAERLPKATGVWIDSNKPTARKICAIGVHASRYVTTHGFAFNINTDLKYYKYINPCGFTDKGVTSLATEQGYETNINEVKSFLQHYLKKELYHETFFTG